MRMKRIKNEIMLLGCRDNEDTVGLCVEVIPDGNNDGLGILGIMYNVGFDV